MYSVFTKQIYHLKIHSRPKKYWNGISSLTFFLKHLSGTLKFDWLITPGSFSLYKPLVTDRSHLLAWTFRYWFTLNYVSYVYVKKKKRNPVQNLLSWVRADIQMAVLLCVSFRFKNLSSIESLKHLHVFSSMNEWKCCSCARSAPKNSTPAVRFQEQ